MQMGYMYRYNPAVMLLRDVLKRGWLGEVFEVHMVMSKVVAAPGRLACREYSSRMVGWGASSWTTVVDLGGQPKPSCLDVLQGSFERVKREVG